MIAPAPANSPFGQRHGTFQLGVGNKLKKQDWHLEESLVTLLLLAL